MKKASWFYIFMKVLVRFTLQLYFKRIEVYGLKNIPKNVPLIFTSNHQGTLMDGVLLVITSDRNIASLVRADIFKNPFVKWILQKFMLVPIYRPRDGGNPLEKNQEVFRDCFKFLKEKGAITIFPEGGNGMEWFLRPLKKGISRIALGAENQNNFDLDVHIIPTYIHYHNHTKFRSDVAVRYGKPIKLKDYKLLHRESENKAVRQLTAAVKIGILQNMVNITDFENHDTIKNWLLYKINYDQYNLKKRLNFGEKINAMQRRIAQLNLLKTKQLKAYQNFLINVEDYTKQLKQNNFKDWMLARKATSIGTLFFYFLILFILGPLWLYCFVNCLLAYCTIKAIIKKLELAPYFLNALKSFLGLFVGGFIFVIQAIIFWLLSNSFWLTLSYLSTLPLAGIFLYNYHIWTIKFRSLMKYNQLIETKNVTKILALRSLIMKDL